MDRGIKYQARVTWVAVSFVTRIQFEREFEIETLLVCCVASVNKYYKEHAKINSNFIYAFPFYYTPTKSVHIKT